MILEFLELLNQKPEKQAEPKLDLNQGLFQFQIEHNEVTDMPMVCLQNNAQTLFSDDKNLNLCSNLLSSELEPLSSSEYARELSHYLKTELNHAECKDIVWKPSSKGSLRDVCSSVFQKDFNLYSQNQYFNCSKFDLLTGEFQANQALFQSSNHKKYEQSQTKEGKKQEGLPVFDASRPLCTINLQKLDSVWSDLERLGEKQNKKVQKLSNSAPQLENLGLDQLQESSKKLLKVLSFNSEIWMEQAPKVAEEKKGKKPSQIQYIAKSISEKEFACWEWQEHQAPKSKFFQSSLLAQEEEYFETVPESKLQDDTIYKTFQNVKVSTVKTQNSKKGTSDEKFKFAEEDEEDISDFHDRLPKSKMPLTYEFELDAFQKRAVLRIQEGKSILVCAHTSAGKTAVAEYSVALARSHRRKVVYTSPIKALSNQKYKELSKKFNGDVGVVTGDVIINPQSQCLIMTTEILRSMLYNGSDTIRDVEWVIFDEVHYMNNAERGVVWEETIIMLPPHIGIVMLSATIPNYMSFANWVGRTKQRTIYVQKTYKRPVPLVHYLFHKGVCKEFKNHEEKIRIDVLEELKMGHFLSEQERKRIQEQKKLDNEEKKDKGHFKNKRKAQQLNYIVKKATDQFIKAPISSGLESGNQNLREDQRCIKDAIAYVQKQKFLPCVFFLFSKKKILEIVSSLQGLELNDKQEKNKAERLFKNALKKLKPHDQELKQLIQLEYLCKNGIAIHHGDLLPIAKEIVEILFSQSLIKVLFATETFAMGINMPAKTVIFHSLNKHDGTRLRNLTSSEYTQMCGRAGRRGLDEKGMVLILVQDPQRIPSKKDFEKMMDKQGEDLQSKFKISYEIILNLITSKEINVQEMMKKSFFEESKLQDLPSLQNRVKALTSEIKKLKNLSCLKSSAMEPPVEFFTNIVWQLQEQCYDANKLVNRDIHPPLFVLVMDQKADLELGLLHYDCFAKDSTLFVYFTEEIREFENQAEIQKKKLQFRIQPENIKDTNILKISHGPRKYQLREFELDYEEIVNFYEIKTDSKKKHKNAKFTEEELAMILIEQKNKLRDLTQIDQQLKAYNFARQLSSNQLKDLEDITSLRDVNRSDVCSSPCFDCKLKDQHLKQWQDKKRKEKDLSVVNEKLEETTKSSTEFDNRLKVLKELNYIDSNDLPLIKARIAKEVGSIFVSEILVNNVLQNLEACEIAVILQAFISQYQIKHNAPKFQYDQCDDFSSTLVLAIESAIENIKKVVEIETKNDVQYPEEDLKQHIDTIVNWELSAVIYWWAKKKTFADICKMTQAQEGAIVRTILRLENLLRNVRNAAKIMGHLPIIEKLDSLSELIKRDIVFVQSLYFDND